MDKKESMCNVISEFDGVKWRNVRTRLSTWKGHEETFIESSRICQNFASIFFFRHIIDAHVVEAYSSLLHFHSQSFSIFHRFVYATGCFLRPVGLSLPYLVFLLYLPFVPVASARSIRGKFTRPTKHFSPFHH